MYKKEKRQDCTSILFNIDVRGGMQKHDANRSFRRCQVVFFCLDSQSFFDSAQDDRSSTPLRMTDCLIPVMLRFVRAFNRNTNIFGLVF
jgi:hypothetical protein